LNILTIPSWYPNPKLKTQGLFFRDQALALSKKHNVDVIYCHRGTAFYNKKYNDNGLVNTYQIVSLPMSDLKMILAKVNTEHNRNLVDNVASQVQETYKKPFNKNLTN